MDYMTQTPASPERIKVIDNFVEPEDLQILDDLCRNKRPENGDAMWWENKSVPSEEYTFYALGAYKESCQRYRDSWGNPYFHPILKKYMNKLSAMISYECGHKLVPIFDFCRMETLEGGYCPGHTDAEGAGPSGTVYMPEYSPLHVYEPNLIDMSANIYVNNDFSGGQLYFPQYDITIEHTPGQVVWFPGSNEYIHAVHEVAGGTRFNLITHFARPKLIEMHSMIHNMYVSLTDEQKKQWPDEWNGQETPRGTRDDHDYRYDLH